MTSDIVSRRALLVGASALAGSALAACRGSGPTPPVDSSAVARSADSTTTPPVTTPSTPSSTATPTTATPTTATPTTASPTIASPTTASDEPGAAWSDLDAGELDAFLEASGTDGFAMAESGVRIHEWYRSGSVFGRDVASAQKSVLSLLVGRAVADGHVTLDTRVDDVLGTGWTTHGRTSEITVRHLLTMTSGLDDALNVVSEPGTAWLYSGAFAQLFPMLTETTGRDVNDIADDWLFGPAGATTAQFYERRSSQFAPIGLYSTVDDLVAIGQTALDPAPLALGPDWLADSFSGIEQNQAYGYLWWLNDGDDYLLPGQRRQRSGALIPAAPADMVSALGKDDQKLYLVPGWSLVVSRLGQKAESVTSAARSGFDNDLWTLLTRLRG